MGNCIAQNSIDHIGHLNKSFGVESLHPMASIITLSKINDIKPHYATCNVYAVAYTLYTDEERSPRNDGYAGEVHFRAPGGVGCEPSDFSDSLNGAVLIFSGELMTNTLLANRLSAYPFFNNRNPMHIQLPEGEMRMVTNCICSIQEELLTPPDKYTNRILAAGIAVLLNVCQRYYERQGNRSIGIDHNITTRLNILLSNHLSSPASEDKQMPTVASCAHALQLSANYLGDLVRKQTGVSAHQYIQRYIVSEIKYLLSHSDSSIADIAYKLGIKYPHHLTRLFKRETGFTPQQYRSMHSEAQ